MRFDDVLREVGEFGPHQKRLFFLLCIPAVSGAMQVMITIFVMDTPTYRCAIPEYHNDTYDIQDEMHEYLLNQSVPAYHSTAGVRYDECHVYATNLSSANQRDGDNAATERCRKWVYDRSVYTSTIVQQMNLVCDEGLSQPYAQMVLMAGSLVGSVLLGVPADIFGRRPVLLVCLAIHSLTSILVTWAPNFAVVCLLYFLNGTSLHSSFAVAFILSMEMVGPSARMWTGTVMEVAWSSGVLLLAGLAFLLRDWRSLQLAASLPTLLFLAFFWLIPESPRWLLTKGREEESERLLGKVAERNRKNLPRGMLGKVNLSENRHEPVWHMFTYPRLLGRSLVIFFIWMVCSMSFYGLGLNVGNLRGSTYVNFLLAGLVEAIGFGSGLFTLNRFGRRLVLSFSMIIGGLCCMGTIAPILYGENKWGWSVVALAMLGRLGVSSAFNAIWIISSELFPTVVRNSCMGISSACARVGGLVAPLLAGLGVLVEGELGRAVPLLTFGVAGLGAGLLALLLPETLGRPLPQTVEDAHNFCRITPPVTPATSEIGSVPNGLLEVNRKRSLTTDAAATSSAAK